MRTFQELVAWQQARALCSEVHEVSGARRFARHFALQNQSNRAAISIMANIAEGFGRYGRNDFHRFVVIARGSAMELQSHLFVALDLGLIDPSTHAKLDAHCIRVQQLLAALRASLRPPS